MGNDRIKSSIELAMEKLAAMPKLSQEETARQLQKEYAPVGRALAAKQIEGRLREGELERDLAKYSDEKRTIVKDALLSALKQAVGLEDIDKNSRVFAALRLVRPEADIAGIQENVLKVAQAYQRERVKAQERYERQYRDSLQRRGISGSALRPNLRDSKGFAAALAKTTQGYTDKLTELISAL